MRVGEPDVERAGQFEGRYGSAANGTEGRARMGSDSSATHPSAGCRERKAYKSGNEIVYIEEGSVTFEAPGKPAATLKLGEAFTTVAGEVHNVKNASSSACEGAGLLPAHSRHTLMMNYEESLQRGQATRLSAEKPSESSLGAFRTAGTESMPCRTNVSFCPSSL